MSETMKRRIILIEERIDDGWYIKSENVTGLFLWGKDREKLWASLPNVIEKLEELNKLSLAVPGGKPCSPES